MRIPSYLLWLAFAALGVLLLTLANFMQPDDKQPDKTANNETALNKGQEETDPANPAEGGKTGKPITPSPSTPDMPPMETQKKTIVYAEDTMNPVAGATVSLCAKKMVSVGIMGLNISKAMMEPLWKTDTNANGEFEWPAKEDFLYPASTYELVIHAEGFPNYSKPIAFPNPIDKHFYLKKGGTLTGTGLPGTGIPVVLVSQSGLLRIQETNAAGEVVFSDLPSDTYEVMIGDPEMIPIVHNVNQQPRDDLTFPYSVSPGENTSVNLTTLAEGLCEVSGKAPGAEGGEVVLKSRDGTTYLLRNQMLDSDGTFFFPYVPPGEYQFIITPALGKAHIEPLSLEKGNTHNLTIDYQLTKVTGVVTHSDSDKPCPQFQVKLVPTQGVGELSTLTDKDGTFQFKGLIPGAYLVIVSSTAASSTPVTQEVFLKADGATGDLAIKFPAQM